MIWRAKNKQILNNERNNIMIKILITTTCLLTLSACGGIKKEAKYPTGADRASTEQQGGIYSKAPTIWGNGKSILNPDGNEEKGEGITVNSFLWRAALDTISFMPLANADPFGGVILTDWYNDEATPSEEIKLNILILGKELKASAVKVTVFRKVNGKNVAPSVDTARKLEDAILTRARQMRIAQLERK